MTCHQVNREIASLIELEAELVVDLARNLCCTKKGYEQCAHVTIEAILDGPKLGYRYNVRIFKRVRLVSSMHCNSKTYPWDLVAFNLRILMAVLDIDKLKSLTIEVDVGSMGGLVAPEHRDGGASTSAPRDLTRLEKLLKTFRRRHGLMTTDEVNGTLWSRPIAGIKTETEYWCYLYKLYTSPTMFQLWALRWLGNLSKHAGLSLALETADGNVARHWDVPDRQCGNRELGCRNLCCGHGGADPKDLFLLANVIEDRSEGLWLHTR